MSLQCKPNESGKFGHQLGYGADLSHLFDQMFDNAVPLGATVSASLYKLHLYPPGGHFEWHADTQHGASHFATGIVVLGSEFAGGDLLVRHDVAETRSARWRPGSPTAATKSNR
jgi:hypothetical protein